MKGEEKEGSNKTSTQWSYMELISLPPRVKKIQSRVTATRRMNPRALTLVPWVPMRIILTVRSAISLRNDKLLKPQAG